MEKRLEPFSERVEHCGHDHMLASVRKRRLSFFKILVGKFDEELSIPQGFLKHLEQEHSNVSILEGPSGKLWHMTLERTPNSMVLQNGWEKFVKDHSLELGDFLVFQYNGGLHFTVQIFDRTACEKDFSGVGYGEEQEEVMEEPVRDFEIPRSKSGKAKAQKKGGRGKLSASKNVNSPKKKPVIVKNLTGYFEVKSVASYLNGIGTPSIYQNGIFVSKRRAVTEAERARACEAAESFKSSKPCFTIVMKPSQVYRGFYVQIPTSFARKHRFDESKVIILSDPIGRRWEVHRICSTGDRYAFSGGWRIFSLTNNIEEGDACAFELVDECNFHVHIFRVVATTTQTTNLINCTALRRGDHEGKF